jgi:hypothetical protein
MKRFGYAAWNGGLREGKGSVSTESRALETYPYTFFSRYGEKPGTNPEELLDRGRSDTAAIHSVGRLAAEYTLVESVSVTPLDDEILRERTNTRMHRLDTHPDGWSPIDTKNWSPSGSVAQSVGEAL